MRGPLTSAAALSRHTLQIALPCSLSLLFRLFPLLFVTTTLYAQSNELSVRLYYNPLPSHARAFIILFETTTLSVRNTDAPLLSSHGGQSDVRAAVGMEDGEAVEL